MLPYDHTRVRLQEMPPDGRDYVNASLLTNPPSPLCGVPWTYVVGQVGGPLAGWQTGGLLLWGWAVFGVRHAGGVGLYLNRFTWWL